MFTSSILKATEHIDYLSLVFNLYKNSKTISV